MKRCLIPLLILVLLTRIPASAQDDGPRVIPPDLEPITVNNIFRLEPTTTFGFGIVQSLNWSPDGRTLAINGESGVWTVKVDDPEYPRLLREDEIDSWMEQMPDNLTDEDLAPYRDLIRAENPHEIVLSPDKPLLATYVEENVVHVWDTQSREVITAIEIPPTTYPSALTFGPDSALLVAGISNGYLPDGYTTDLVVWDVQSGQEVAVLTDRHLGAIIQFAFNATGTLLAAVDVENLVSISNIETGEMVARFDHYSSNRVPAFNPNGALLATSDPFGQVRLWEVETGRLTQIPHANMFPFELIFVDENTLFATGTCGSVTGWNISTGEPLVEYDCKTGSNGKAVISPDGEWFVVFGGVSDNSVATVWDVSTDEMIAELAGHDRPIYDVAVSSDGLLLASGGFDHSIRLWDTETWEQLIVLEDHTDVILGLGFSPDRRSLISLSGDGSLWLWSVQNVRATMPRAHRLAILSQNQQQTTFFTFSPDGRMLVTSACQPNYSGQSRYDCSLVFWDVASVVPVRVIQIDFLLTHITFNPTGTLIALSSPNNVYLWGVPAP